MRAYRNQQEGTHPGAHLPETRRCLSSPAQLFPSVSSRWEVRPLGTRRVASPPSPEMRLCPTCGAPFGPRPPSHLSQERFCRAARRRVLGNGGGSASFAFPRSTQRCFGTAAGGLWHWKTPFAPTLVSQLQEGRLETKRGVQLHVLQPRGLLGQTARIPPHASNASDGRGGNRRCEREPSVLGSKVHSAGW